MKTFPRACLLLLVWLFCSQSAWGFLASGQKNASRDFFSGSPDCAWLESPGGQEPCWENPFAATIPVLGRFLWTKFDPHGLFDPGRFAKKAGPKVAKRGAQALATSQVDTTAPGPADVAAVGIAIWGVAEISGAFWDEVFFKASDQPAFSVDELAQNSSNALRTKQPPRGFTIENDADQKAYDRYLNERKFDPAMAEANLTEYQNNKAKGVSTNQSARVNWTSYNGRHAAKKNAPWEQQIKNTQNGPAKYLPGTDIESLERHVWENGQDVTTGKPWKVMEFEEEVGASDGETSRWIRVENNGGTIHGHPITEREYQKLTTPQEE